jgi:hypothetical protein
MLQEISKIIKPCKPCQIGKRSKRGYGKIPLKDIEHAPWADVCIDLSGPRKTTIDGKEVIFHTFTAIDPFAGWPEIAPIINKAGQHIVNLMEQEWLRRYPRPNRIFYDKGSEFNNQWFYDLCRRWAIKPEPISVQNPQANAIVERIHRVMGDMIRVQLVKHHPHDDPLRDLLSAAAYGVRSTAHGTTLHTPGQLISART